ncbi:MAG TPA: polysaccharide lyase family 7 protein [Chthonomonadaceae bacterium]|nr:polysaccharide lyase family 7 protein [Chthonomonadaceae bacterium]
MKFVKIIAVMLALLGGIAQAPGRGAPDAAFDLRDWKLQIPGPKEIKELTGYSSDHFYLSGAKEMCFHLDATEKGPTPHARSVRSELRHVANWTLDGEHALSGEFRVASHLKPDKVTTLQIHGIQADHSDAPPLLRIARNSGDLVAAIKTDAEGRKTEIVPLKRAVGDGFVLVDIVVKDRILTIDVDGEQKLRRDLSYWKFLDYFKAGCYPQATDGTVDVFFRKLTVK